MGRDPAFRAAATALGQAIARAGLELVYGGASVGLMGVVADAALALGGDVTGVLPRALAERELAHGGLTRLHLVETMHARKALMADLSDGFVALPGGIGTLEELFEIWTWAQLGDHAKPIALLEVAGFYAPLLGFLDRLVDTGFVKAEQRAIALVDSDPAALLARMAGWRSVAAPKWIGHGER